MYTSFPDEISVVVPHPSVERYCAIVLVKPPELEKIAIEPLIKTSSGWSPPSAPKIRVNPDQFRNAVANTRRRKIDHASIEGQASVESLTDVVVNGNISDVCSEDLPSAARRCSKRDIAARERVAHRRDVTRLASKDVQDADPIVAGRNLTQSVHPEVIREAFNTLQSHDPVLPCAFRLL